MQILERQGHALMRGVAEHAQWFVPVTEDYHQAIPGPMRTQRADGGWWLRAFSSEERLRHDIAKCERFTTMSGEELLTGSPGNAAGLQIDALDFGAERLVALLRWGIVVQLERALSGARFPLVDAFVAKFAHYLVVLDGDAILIAPPGPAGGSERLAAAFTAPDCLEQFLEQHVRNLGLPQQRVLELPGAELFPRLDAMAVDGVVFNCKGPPKPRAFGARFLDAMARRVAQR